MHHLRIRHQPLTGLVAAWLVAALLLAQALGLMHRSAHLPDVAAPAHVQAPSQPAHWVHELFAGHARGAADCLLLDALLQAGAPACEPAPLPPAAPLAFVAQVPDGVTVPWTAFFQARGPPARS